MNATLNLDRLDKVHTVNGKTLARCPACAESGADTNGDHLCIDEVGRFGCVKFPGSDGTVHRQRIFALAGTVENAAARPHNAPLSKQAVRTWAPVNDAVRACTPRGFTLAAVYDFPKAGRPFAAVARYEREVEKTFRQFSIHGAKWRATGPGESWPLYRVETLPVDGPLFIVEGEKCQHAAADAGLPCVTSAGGSKNAARSDWRPLAGRDVMLLPDADSPGETYAATVAAILSGQGCRVRVLRLPGLSVGQDIADYLDAGNDAETVVRLAADAPMWTPPQVDETEPDTEVEPEAVLDYYDAVRKEYLVRNSESARIGYNETQFKRILRGRGVSSKIQEGEHLSEVDKTILEAQDTRSLVYAGPLAGWPAGVHEYDNGRFMVTRGPRLIDPEPGAWPNLEAFFKSLLADDPEQFPVFMGWMKVAFESLRAGAFRPGQALTMAGEHDTGKSLAQILITEFLGGRRGRPYQYLAGRTEFNKDLFEAEHLTVEDDVPSSTLADRRNFGAKIKRSQQMKVIDCMPRIATRCYCQFSGGCRSR